MEENIISAEVTKVPVVEIDRVGDVGQKEIALSTAGLKRVEVYKRIKEMLDAVKVSEKIVHGVIEQIEEPDMSLRARGVELALKAFGDLKEFDKAGSVTNNFTFATMVKLASTVHNNLLPTVEPEKISDVAVDAAFKNRVIDAG